MKIVLFNEWEALYDDDGKLLMQDHSLDAATIIRYLGGQVITPTKKQEDDCMNNAGAPEVWT